MQRKFQKLIRNLLSGFLLLTGVVNASQHQSEDNSPLQIRLRPITEVADPNVRLADIATFFRNDRMCTLGDLSEAWQRQLRQVEVVRLTHERRQATIFRNSVKIRLLDALETDFKLIGPEVLVVSLAKPRVHSASNNPFRLIGLTKVEEESDTNKRFPRSVQTSEVTDLSIERAIRDELAAQFSIDKNRLQVTLLRSVVGLRNSKLKDLINPIVEVTAPVKMPYGRHNLPVRILDGSRMAMSQQVSVNVGVRQSLLMARRPISAGTLIEASMLTEDVRMTDRHYDELLLDDVVGMMAIRPLQSQDIIAWNNLRDPSSIPVAQTKPIINVRDAVKVVASHKALRIAVSAAEAMESGRKGQLIRVRNIQSRKVFSARVVRAGEVQLIL